MAELVDANDSKSFVARREGSSPSPGTHMKKPKLLVLVGPTSSGKSALAVELARTYNGEVISADSRQVYRGLDIGTGKITKKEMCGVAHHLLDVADPKRIFTAHDYIRAAQAAVDDILARKKLPIVTGGTGFYIDALLGRITLPDVPADPAFRRIHNKIAIAELLCMLEKKDPERAASVDPHNKVRIIRALEIAHKLGKVPAPSGKKSAYDVLWVGIAPERDDLRKKIHERLLARVKQGMVKEARSLHKKGLSFKRMGSFGLEYRALARLLQNKCSRKDMLTQLDTDIWHYAKRQLTYWGRNKDIRWFAPKAFPKLKKAVGTWYAH